MQDLDEKRLGLVLRLTINRKGGQRLKWKWQRRKEPQNLWFHLLFTVFRHGPVACYFDVCKYYYECSIFTEKNIRLNWRNVIYLYLYVISVIASVLAKDIWQNSQIWNNLIVIPKIKKICHWTKEKWNWYTNFVLGVG